MIKAVKNNRYGIKNGVRLAYQAFIQGLAENDEKLLKSICEPRLYNAAIDSMDYLNDDIDDDLHYKLILENQENFSKSQIILQLQSEIPDDKSQQKHQRLKPHIEKSYELNQSNLSKIPKSIWIQDLWPETINVFSKNIFVLTIFEIGLLL